MATLKRKLEGLKQLKLEALKQNKHDLVRRVDETYAEKNAKYYELMMKVMYEDSSLE